MKVCVVSALLLGATVPNSAVIDSSTSSNLAAPAPTIAELTPPSGTVGTSVTLSGANFGAAPGTGTTLLSGKVGEWGPFRSGMPPDNLIAGMPNGSFVGSPTYTSDGGGAIVSTDESYLAIPDGGAGGAYDWTTGAWSVQVDFMFPTSPAWPTRGGAFGLVSKGSFNAGSGWEIMIAPTLFREKYQLELLSNHGVNSYTITSSYQVAPGAFHRALFVCDGAGQGRWYVNGEAWSPGPSVAPASAATDLIIGRHSDGTGGASTFPISRVQIWNRALTGVEAALSTSADLTAGTVTFNGTPATPTSWSDTSIVVPVPNGATTGPVVVTVDGQPSNGVTFAVTTPPAPPSITSLSPLTGEVGTIVTVTGADFGESQGDGTVTFNGTPASPTIWTASSIVAPVPSGATSGPVVVTVGGNASNAFSFEVIRPASTPTITSLSPASGPQGTLVTVTGANFGFASGTPSLLNSKIGAWGPFQPGVAPDNQIAGMPNGSFVGSPTFTEDGGGAITSDDANYLTIADGGAGGTYDWTSGPWTVQVDFTFPSAPVWPKQGVFYLASKGSFSQGTGWAIIVTPTTYQGKHQIELLSNHGVNSYHIVSSYQIVPGQFHRALFICDGAGSGRWFVNGIGWSAAPCASPAAAASDLVIGRNAGGTGAASSFPISRVQIWNRALTEAEAAESTTTDPSTAAGTVTFNGTVATPASWSPASIVVPVPGGATTGPVVVTVNGQPSNPVDFTVTTPIATPSITGLSPFTGPVGTSVSLTGTNFGTAQGASTVTFNGTPAGPTSWSPSSIVVPVPSGATTGPVVVTVGGQASNAVVFTVTTVSASRELWVDKNSLGGPCSDSRSVGSVTRTTPYCTLWAAISHVVPGDFVHVRGGTYVESLRPIRAGTASQWIRFAAEPGETVTLQGGGDVTSGIQLFVREATPSFNEISGFHVMNMSHNCVMVDSVPDVRLINLEVSGCGGSGAVELHQTQRVTLEGSRIHDNATTGWTSAVDLFECGDGNVVRGNWIWSNSDNPSGNPDSEGHGITMDLCGSAGGALIENNVIWNNEGWGISIYRSDGATIRNNTLYQNGIRSGGEIMSLGNRVAIHNNILVPRSGRIALNMRYTSSGYSVDPATLQEDSDLIGASAGAAVLQWGDSVGTLARYRAENPRGWGVMTQAADPLFVNPSAADFHLTAGSPARDTGDDTHAASIDIEGRPRPSGPATDRGAYERGPG